MVEVVNTLVHKRLPRKLRKSVIIHQYADDTVLIANTDVTTMVTLKIILRLFTTVSSLKINYDKSSWIPINLEHDHFPVINAILGCSMTNFLINYLGLPLSILRPTNASVN